MKSRITILLALLLALVCIAASAQEYYTLSEIREQAAQGWHETYLAYGREIVADVDVNMPDVDVLPIDKIELARLFPSSDNGNGGIKITARPDENIFAFDSMAYLAIPEHVVWKYERQYAPPYDLRKIYAENSSLCLGDAIETIRNALAEVELDEIGWSETCLYAKWYLVCHGLPVYVEMTLGIAFSAAIWAIVALAVAVWIPDRLLVISVPSCIYYLWHLQLPYILFGINIPHPGTLYNDALTVEMAAECILTYLVVLLISISMYIAGLRRRACDA